MIEFLLTAEQLARLEQGKSVSLGKRPNSQGVDIAEYILLKHGETFCAVSSYLPALAKTDGANLYLTVPVIQGKEPTTIHIDPKRTANTLAWISRQKQQQVITMQGLITTKGLLLPKFDHKVLPADPSASLSLSEVWQGMIDLVDKLVSSRGSICMLAQVIKTLLAPYKSKIGFDLEIKINTLLEMMRNPEEKGRLSLAEVKKYLMSLLELLPKTPASPARKTDDGSPLARESVFHFQPGSPDKEMSKYLFFPPSPVGLPFAKLVSASPSGSKSDLPEQSVAMKPQTSSSDSDSTASLGAGSQSSSPEQPVGEEQQAFNLNSASTTAPIANNAPRMRTLSFNEQLALEEKNEMLASLEGGGTVALPAAEVASEIPASKQTPPIPMSPRKDFSWMHRRSVELSHHSNSPSPSPTFSSSSGESV